MSASSSRLSRYFSLFKTALSGTETEFTSGSINRAVFLLAVPMVLEMVMESLFAVVDAYFVARLGNDALTTVGLTESVIGVVYSIGFGLSMAATAFVARRIGEKDPEGAAVSAAQAIALTIGLSLLISLLGILFGRDVLVLMGQAPAAAAANAGYARIMFGSNAVIMLLFLLNGIFRGAGNASIAMRSLWLANGLNILLCPLLIFGWGPVPALGLKGAAIATATGRGIAVLYQCYNLFKGKGILHIVRRHWQLRRSMIADMVKVAAGGTAQLLINTVSWIALARIVASYGEAASAGYTIGIRVIIFTLLPALGMSNAASTLVGQNLGAGQPERAEQSVYRAALLNMIFLGTVSVLFFVFAPDIVSLFTKDALVAGYAVRCLRYLSVGYVLYAWGMVIISAFNGAGDTRTPTIINIFAFLVFQIPLAWLLARVAGLGPTGVFWAVTVTESCIAIVGILLFRRGRWKAVKV